MLQKINIKNKKAYFEYEILSNFTAGIVLCGSEIKSIRNSQASLSDSYCVVIKSEIFIRNLHIGEYKHASHNNHTPKRERKLLLNKIEIKKIKKQLNEKGMTLIPTKLLISEKGFAKIEIGLGKGKKLYDKRETLKKRDANLEIERKKKGEINSP